MPKNDPYKILNVTRKSTPQEIISSFKKLRYKYHPDRPKGNRLLYDQVIEAYASIQNNPQSYVNVNEFIKNYKGSEEELRDIIEAYNKYKGDMQKILDSLILVEDSEEEKIREILKNEIKKNNIKKYKKFEKKIKKRRNESKKAEEIAKKMGINLDLSLEELLNREDNRQEELIKRLEDKYTNIKSLKK
ncbi:DnaJ subfamily C member 9 (DNJC9) [Vairimorpha necatrix]|uniref:DnaJ subfamily C member 9 (DNJC9) n=1 Tax=Vairimorpha necatrix TaxID=6039 RepID=A0AAX4JB34_9MICR